MYCVANPMKCIIALTLPYALGAYRKASPRSVVSSILIIRLKIEFCHLKTASVLWSLFGCGQPSECDDCIAEHQVRGPEAELNKN